MNKKTNLLKVCLTGELKLLEVVRALATEPQMLLLDEPFTGVGTKESERLIKLIREEMGVMILLV